MKKIFFITIIVIILMLIPYNFTYAKVMGEGAENGGTGNQDFGLGDLENYRGTNPESQTLQNATNNIFSWNSRICWSINSNRYKIYVR